MRFATTFRAGVGVLSLLGAAALPGCIIVANGYNESDAARYSEVRTLRVPVAAGCAVNVKTRNGGVDVSASTGSEAVITATVRARTQERLDETKIVAAESQGTLTVEVAWPGAAARSGEGCTFRIESPSPRNVTVVTSNGRITLRDTAGHAELDTSNAAVRVASHAGDVNATTSNGQIDARDVTGAVDASTSNGGIDLSNIGGRAFATTSNGHATVQLTDQSAGPVQVRTSNGGIDLGLGRAFSGELRLSTSNGRLKFDSPVMVSSFDSGKSATLQFGSGGGRSSATTSNGSISVTSHASAEVAPVSTAGHD